MSAEEAVEKIYKHVAARLKAGAPDAEIEEELLAMGLVPELATTAIVNVRRAAAGAASKRRAGSARRGHPPSAETDSAEPGPAPPKRPRV
jgi:hypothetical protein